MSCSLAKHAKLGFVPVIKKDGTPHVSVDRYIKKDGTVEDRNELVLIEGMMYVVLLHEMDHVTQILTRFWAQGLPHFTYVWEKTDRGGWRNNPHYPGVLRMWQNNIHEYEVRLLEFKRLYENNADEATLVEAAQAGVVWSQRYWSAVGLGKSKTRMAWERQFAPQLQELRVIVNYQFKQAGFKFAQYEVEKNPYRR